MKFRVGRHNPAIIYAQLTDRPDDNGQMVAVCTAGATAAARLVEILNRGARAADVQALHFWGRERAL